MKALLLALPLLMSGNTPDFETYCQSGTNSIATAAAITGQGTPERGSSDCTLVVNDMIPGTFSAMTYSTVPLNMPFGDGWLCVHPAYTNWLPGPMQTPQNGTRSWLTSLSFANPGDTLYFQAWYRDPGFSNEFNTSNGLKVNVRP